MSRCFLNFKQGDKELGRIIIELFSNIVPITCANFISLCTGDKGKIGNSKKKKLYYKNSVIHRVIKNFMIQMGDFTHGDGTGGVSIYGATFPDENFKIKHSKYYLSMANAGPNTNSSQFFICTGNCHHLNGKHVVFGKVIQGMHIIDKIELVETNDSDRPILPIIISKCGQLVLVKKNKNKNENENDLDLESNHNENDDNDDSDIDDSDDSEDSNDTDDDNKNKRSKKKIDRKESVVQIDSDGRIRKGRGSFKYFQRGLKETNPHEWHRKKQRNMYFNKNNHHNTYTDDDDDRIKLRYSQFVAIPNYANTVSSLISVIDDGDNDTIKHRRSRWDKIPNTSSHRSNSRSRSRSRSRSHSRQKHQ